VKELADMALVVGLWLPSRVLLVLKWVYQANEFHKNFL